jgi:polyphosphate kinase 2
MVIIRQIIKEELVSEGYFKDLVKKSFKKNDETIEQKAQYVDDIFDEFKKYGIVPGQESKVQSKKGREYPAYSPQGSMILNYSKTETAKDFQTIIKMLQDILLSKKSNELNFELLKRNIQNILLKKGSKTKNTIKYLEKVFKSLESRKDYEKNLPAEEYYEPEEEEEKSILPRKQYVKEKNALQVELLKMQEWLKDTGRSVIVVFEGRDTAGKGSTIKKFTEHLNPRFYKVVAKGVPTPEERKDWFGRYESDIEPGKIIFFDRSWYNRGIVEPVMGYSSYEEYESFMAQVNSFERKLVSEGNVLIKFWLSVTKETQAKRFRIRQTSPLAYWKYSPNDAKAQEMWDQYTKYKNRVLKLTSTSKAPWVVVDSNDKRISGLNAMRYVLNQVPYEGKNETVVGEPYPEVVTKI